MDAPTFPQPMYEALRDLSPDYLFPGLEHVPPDTVQLLQTNNRFIESFMVGLNSEMARELLWRGYPTDQRGTYFRQFWDATSAVPTTRPTFRRFTNGATRALGTNARERGQDQLVLLIRGELLRRYPGRRDLRGQGRRCTTAGVCSPPISRGRRRRRSRAIRSSAARSTPT